MGATAAGEAVIVDAMEAAAVEEVPVIQPAAGQPDVVQPMSTCGPGLTPWQQGFGIGVALGTTGLGSVEGLIAYTNSS